MTSTFLAKDELPSTTFSLPSTSTTASTPSSTNVAATGNGAANNNGMQRGASYFFGFLITFIALLLIFIGCGVSTRRRFARRRQLFAVTELDWGAPGATNIEQERPGLYDPWLAKGDVYWDSMKPLSAVAILPTDAAGISLPPSKTAQQSVLERMRHRIFHPHLFGFSHTHRGEREASLVADPALSEAKTTPVSTAASPDMLEVTVMIAMPAPHATRSTRNSSGHDEKLLDEYVFGVSRIDWKGKEWVS